MSLFDSQTLTFILCHTKSYVRKLAFFESFILSLMKILNEEILIKNLFSSALLFSCLQIILNLVQDSNQGTSIPWSIWPREGNRQLKQVAHFYLINIMLNHGMLDHCQCVMDNRYRHGRNGILSFQQIKTTL